MKRTTRSATKVGTAVASTITDVSVHGSMKTNQRSDISEKAITTNTKSQKNTTRGKKKLESDNKIPVAVAATVQPPDAEDSESLPDILVSEETPVSSAVPTSTNGNLAPLRSLASDDDDIVLLSDSDEALCKPSTGAKVLKRAKTITKPPVHKSKAKAKPSKLSAKRSKKCATSVAPPVCVDLLDSSSDNNVQSALESQMNTSPMEVCEESEVPDPDDSESCDSVPVISKGSQRPRKHSDKNNSSSSSPFASLPLRSGYEDSEKASCSKAPAAATKGFTEVPMECYSSDGDDFQPKSQGKKRISPRKIYSSSSEEEQRVSEPKKEHGLVSSRKDFASMISQVQGKLKGPTNLTSADLLAKNENDPVARKLLAMASKSKQKIKPVATASSYSPSSATRYPVSSSTVASSPKKSHVSVMDRPLTASQLAVADLDTDTELEMDDIPRRAKHQSSRSRSSNRRRQSTHSSSEDDPGNLDESFENFLKRNDKKPQPSSAMRQELETQRPSVTADEWIPDNTHSPKAPKTPVELRWQPGYIKILIRFRGKDVKFDGNEMWDVSNVRKILAEKTNVQTQNILLYTPKDVKMNDGQKLVAYEIETGDRLEATLRSVQGTEDKPKEKNPDSITLKFQKSGLKKPIFLDVSKYNEFSDIRDLVAQELKVDSTLLYFQFDGESIDLSQSPADLDIENEECIDVFEK